MTTDANRGDHRPLQAEGAAEYQHLMQRCFAEYHRVLKPGRWMTVVFSNSRAAVWNAIQVALQQAGFVVAEVSALDKKQGSYRQVTSTTAVKQDLVISVYKPNGGLEQRLDRTRRQPRVRLGLRGDAPATTAGDQAPERRAGAGRRARPAARLRPHGRLVRPSRLPGAAVQRRVPRRLAAARLPGARRHDLPALAGRRVRQEARPGRSRHRRWSCSSPTSAAPSTGWQSS